MTTRHLPFERGVNFRDLGGYKTADGRRVKWRKLFRCGAMDRLTPDDVAKFAELEIVAVCDFRGQEEYTRQPSNLPESMKGRVHQLEIEPGGHASADDDLVEFLGGRRTAAELTARICGVYREIALDFAPVYATMFRHLLEAQGQPLLIHCMGGKDRTGIGAALILSALGVPEETIFEDYMLSAESVPLRIWLNSLIDRAAKKHPLTRPREEILEEIIGLWGVSPDWLHTALRAMDEVAGSVPDFIKTVLHVAPQDLERLRSWYLDEKR